MVSEWKSVPLKEAATFFSGGTPPKSNPDYWGGEIPWISAKSMHGCRYSDSELKLTEAGLNKGSKLAPKGAVLLLVRGSMLHQRIPVGITTREVAFNQDVKAIIPNEDFLPLYFYYCFAGREHEFLSKVENTGIGAGKLDTDVLNKIEFLCPPLPEQKAITHILSSLDDKIELNRQMNEILESMAQALFKSWFVDFDPVIENALAKGNDIPKTLYSRAEVRRSMNDKFKHQSQEILKQFPSSFIFDDEMGFVPESWRVGTLLDYAELISGGTPKTSDNDYWDGDIPWASAKDISQCSDAILGKSERCITNAGLENSSTKLVGKYSTVIVSRGATTGRLAMVGGDFAMNQTCYALRSKHQIHFYQYCKTKDVISSLVNAAHGSIFDTITTTTFRSTSVLLPPVELAKQFDKLASAYFYRLHKNLEESSVLIKLQDTLLPKLLSGELGILDAEKLIDEIEA